MKARSLLASTLALLTATILPLLAQQTPETPTTDTSTPKRIRIQINDKVIDVDSIDSRLFDVEDLDFDGDLDMNVQVDTAGGDFNFQTSGSFDQKKFQEEMAKFQEKMQQWQKKFQEKMQQWQKKFQEKMESMEIEMESMNADGDDGRVLRLRSGDSNVLAIGRARRLRMGDSDMSQTVDANAEEIRDIRSRIDGIRQELTRLPKNDPRRAELNQEMDRARAELGAIEGLNRRLQMIVVNGDHGVSFVNEGGEAIGMGSSDGDGFAWANGSGIWTSVDDEGGEDSGDCYLVQMDCDTMKGGKGRAMSFAARSRRDGQPAKSLLMRIESQGVTPRLMIKTITFSGDQSTISPADQVFNDQAVQLHRSEVVIGGDTIGLDDGREGQTVIRIDHGQSVDGKTQVVIMTLRRGAGRDAAKSSSAPVAPNSTGFTLGENFPNPASEQTTIAYTAPKAGNVNISIFDNTGRLVRTLLDREVEAGAHAVVVNTDDLPSGLYLYRMVSDGFSETKTMTVMR